MQYGVNVSELLYEANMERAPRLLHAYDGPFDTHDGKVRYMVDK